MNYVALARRYRPKVFDEVVGQEHITTTLKNAISKERTAHAYLFAGPRGTGKTTTARILAKALNCEKAAGPDPCNSCATCDEINRSLSLDVLEIDGASNRGIDEIRNLREGIKFSPARGRFKVYIIDEVHMLTPEAFNALLKVLEEPPHHAKFIFATTAPHKVPPTILSRCQRFDFRRISTKDILENLKNISKSENLKVKDEALALIAKSAEGSMRDGQVILDQIVSFSQGTVTPEDVLKILGLIDDEMLFGLSGAIRSRGAEAALRIIDRAVNEGKDLVQVVFGLIEHFRDILIMKTAKDFAPLLDASAEKIKRLEEEAAGFTTEEVLYVVYTLSNTADLMKKTTLERVPLELAMVKLTRFDSIVSLSAILDKIEALGRRGKISPQPTVHSPQSSVVSPQLPEKNNSNKELEEALSSWARVIDYIKEKKISIASYLQEGYPINTDSGSMTIGFPREFQFHKEVLEEAGNRRLIEEAIKEVMKADLKVALVIVESAAGPANAGKEYPERPVFNDEANAATEETHKEVEPIVKDALSIFNGEIVNRKNKGK